MAVTQDLTGQRFGLLTVIGRTEPDENRRKKWICRCDCGKEIAVLTSNLKRRPNVSCGCGRMQDLAGKKIGTLTVLERSDRYGTRGKRKQQLWKCLCDCGEVTYKPTDQLTNPSVSMCKACAGKFGAQKAREGCGYTDGTQVSKIQDIDPQSDNRSGVRGVYMDGKTGKYRARIKFRGVIYNLGTFYSLEAAAKARRTAEAEMFGAYLESRTEE
ncbi:MAG: hypothetical protein J6V25_13115 [Oscillospiraceae bacterium]|nr:hypothetical protein [Oscillospiraceae bacterium]